MMKTAKIVMNSASTSWSYVRYLCDMEYDFNIYD